MLPDGFVAVVRTEVLFNLRRAAPYALMVVFSANAILWWGWGPAIERGWAVNSDFFIVWMLGGFSFMTMPLFVALMMGDPVLRDHRIGIDPLIYSKPVGSGEYLLGKFVGNFLVLVCAQACFMLTPLLLQMIRLERMTVLPPRVLPYVQHFFFFVVVSSFALAAVFFTLGTLTRSVRVVYGVAISCYPLYVAWQLAIRSRPAEWRIFWDPLLFNVGGNMWQGRSIDLLNHLAVEYDGFMVLNRVILVGVSILCLALLVTRFSMQERAITGRALPGPLRPPARAVPGERQALPHVTCVTLGWRAACRRFMASLGVEWRLLRAERSLVVVAPLVALLCLLELAAFGVSPGESWSAAYAARIANALLIFLFGVAAFYTGETAHRDRELGVEPILWSAPAPDGVLLLSKASATFLLSVFLIALAAAGGACVQLSRGHTPFEPLAYLKVIAVILMPTVFFLCATALALNVLLRDKHVTYAAVLAIGGAVYSFGSAGPYPWLHNPVLHRLWSPSDLAGSQLTRILTHRLYTVALAVTLLSLAFAFFERRPARARRLPLLVAAIAGLITAFAGYAVVAHGAS